MGLFSLNINSRIRIRKYLYETANPDGGTKREAIYFIEFKVPGRLFMKHKWIQFRDALGKTIRYSYRYDAEKFVSALMMDAERHQPKGGTRIGLFRIRQGKKSKYVIEFNISYGLFRKPVWIRQRNRNGTVMRFDTEEAAFNVLHTNYL